MQSMATRSGFRAARRCAASAVAPLSALGLSTSTTTSTPGRERCSLRISACSAIGISRPSRPRGSSAPASPFSTREGNSTPASPAMAGNSPVQLNTSTSAPSRLSAASVAGARSATARFDIVTSRPLGSGV